MTTAVWY